MISDQEYLHGAAFLKLINYGLKVSIIHAADIHSSLYLVKTDQRQSAILFKVSKKPKSAWPFTLSEGEEAGINLIKSKYPLFSVFLALVCHKDGICCIAKDRLWTVLDQSMAIGGQHISVSRTPHGRYHIKGPGRQQMEQTVPQNDWPRIVLLN